MILNEEDSNSMINMKLGDIFNVNLRENPTTGYRWDIECFQGFKLIEDYFESGKAIGAIGLRMLKFQTISIGSHKIHIKYWRNWEGDSSIIDNFNVVIIVNEN
ncbi:protease inhibitor I42 family protein [Bacillus cereus]|nr:protease inhibitor I42 family protein [Bacillus cereus]